MDIVRNTAKIAKELYHEHFGSEYDKDKLRIILNTCLSNDNDENTELLIRAVIKYIEEDH
jgi:hypothetical protein